VSAATFDAEGERLFVGTSKGSLYATTVPANGSAPDRRKGGDSRFSAVSSAGPSVSLASASAATSTTADPSLDDAASLDAASRPTWAPVWVRVAAHPPSAVRELKCSKDGRFLLANCGDKTLRVFDAPALASAADAGLLALTRADETIAAEVSPGESYANKEACPVDMSCPGEASATSTGVADSVAEACVLTGDMAGAGEIHCLGTPPGKLAVKREAVAERLKRGSVEQGLLYSRAGPTVGLVRPRLSLRDQVEGRAWAACAFSHDGERVVGGTWEKTTYHLFHWVMTQRKFSFIRSLGGARVSSLGREAQSRRCCEREFACTRRRGF
jgi:hypothetical protein